MPRPPGQATHDLLPKGLDTTTFLLIPQTNPTRRRSINPALIREAGLPTPPAGRRPGDCDGARPTMKLLFLSLLCAAIASVSTLRASDPAPVILPPLGPHVNLKESDFNGSTTFTSSDRLVVTPYFYWYDVFTGEHLLDADGTDAMTDHPPTMTGFSLRSPSWHRTQLLDMTDAGIDVLLPVYWGEPSQRLPGQPVAHQPWSFAGIPPLVAARDALLQEGRNPPKIGLFYDTSTLLYNAAGRQVDLTTAAGREWFYETVRDFFSLVPPRHWAMIDGKPIVFLYSSAFAVAHDQACIDFLATSFAREFGGRTPFVVREISWQARTEQVYAWGGALGLKNPGVASLGPGYDHSAVMGRQPLVVPRENGAFFERNWLSFLRRPSRMVMIETWNEYHEGTDIAASREYGRQYITLNRRYSDLFKAGYQPPPDPNSFAGSRLVETVLGATNISSGVLQFDSADGATQAAVESGSPCRIAAATRYADRFLYFKIDDGFKWADAMEVLVVVDYLDAARGTMRLDFDGSDLSAPLAGAYSPGGSVALSGSRAWSTTSFHLKAARFLNRQNGGADFRIGVGTLPVGIRRVQVVREGLKALHTPANNACDLQIFGAPGNTYDLEASDDLFVWTPLVRLRPSTASSRHLDSMSPDRAARWYRLRHTAF